MTHLLQLNPNVALRICAFAARDLRELRRFGLINCAAFGEGIVIYGDDARQRAAATRRDDRTILLDGAFRDTENLPSSWRREKALTTWNGVTTRGAHGGVVSIDLWCNLSGPVDLSLLPSSLKKMDLSDNMLVGPVDLTLLPHTMTELQLYGNKLSGSIDLSKLPATMTKLFLDQNKFSGPVDLSRLPAGTAELNLRANLLSGAVDLSHLPASLKTLYLGRNRLVKNIDLSHLPASLTNVGFEHNRLGGVLDLRDVPNQCSVKFEGNNFSQVIEPVEVEI